MKKIALLTFTSFVLFSFTSELDQLIKTKLSVTVLNKLGNPVEGVVVKVFGTKEDYQKKENEVSPAQQTNKKGKTLFVGLEKKAYFIYAEKGDMDNVGSGVQTDTLVIKRINKINTIITDL